MSNETMGVAVIGAGNMGKRHMKNSREIPEFEIRAVADVNAAAAEAQAKEFGAPFWTADFKEAIARPDVDVVFACVPSCFHADVAVEAAQNKKHVFSEKPLALTLEDGERMIQAAQEAGVVLAIDLQQRFQKSFRDIRRILADEDVGTPRYYTIVETIDARPNPAMHNRGLNGGPLMDQFCHWLDMWRFVLGSDPVRVFARGATFATENPRLADLAEKDALAVDTGSVTVEFASGDVGSYQVCWGLPDKTSGVTCHVIVAPKAQIELELFSKITIHRGSEQEVIENPAVNAHLEQLKHFAGCLRNGGRPSTTGEDGLFALKTSLAIMKSIETGEAVVIR